MFVFELTPVLLPFLLAPKVLTVSMEFKAEYFSNTTLVCDDRLLNLPYTTFKKYWILPNGTALQWSHDPGNSSRFIVGEYPDFNLTITQIDEDDFGWYYCVILWDNYIYLVHTIKVGLNVNGALYEELLDQYKKSAITGLIAGASTATLLGLFCLLYWCRYSETNTKNDDKTKKTEHGKRDSTGNKSSTDTVYATEKEAIYELDKAVKGFDDDATVVGDGEVAVGFNDEENEETNSVVEDGKPGKISRLVSFQEETILEERAEIRSNDDETFDELLPPPPPPPLPLLLMKEVTEETTLQRYTNNGFDFGNDTGDVAADIDTSDTDRKYMYQEETACIENATFKEHYADVNF